jgi:dipeptidyl aminopeptidase/acylaminoacyl peptidase
LNIVSIARSSLCVLSLVSAAFLAAAPTRAQTLAPVEAYTADPAFSGAALSPSGNLVAGVRSTPDADYLVVIDLRTHTATPIQRAARDSALEIQWVEFKGDDLVIFGVRQRVRVVDGGNTIRRSTDVDNVTYVSRVYVSGVDGQNLRVLLDNESARLLDRRISHFFVDALDRDPDHVLIGGVTTRGIGLFRVNVRTGENTVIDSGGFDTAGWQIDITGEPVMRQESVSGGRGFAWFYKNESGRWVEFTRFRGANGANSGPTFSPSGAGPAPGTLVVAARKDGDDAAALHLFDARHGRYLDRLFSVDGFDVSEALLRHDDGALLAVCYIRHSYVCEPSDEHFGRYWRALQQTFGEQASIRYIANASDDSRWLIRVSGPGEPGAYFVFTLADAHIEAVANVYPDLVNVPLATVEVFNYTASDGRQLWGYLTVPPGAVDQRNLPMIVMPHGGPEGRDVLGFDPIAQYFASRGYLVFQPNFRGGGGFGRSFVEAGWGQWGRRMQADVSDGARAVIATGRADASRLCIWGWSYGGYVAATATFENQDLYRCSVAGAGVTDLPRMLSWVRDEQGGAQGVSYQYWTDAMGGTERSSELAQYSASRHAGETSMPLLLIHGRLDVTVPYEQSEILQRAFSQAGRNVRLIELPDAQHQWAPMTPDERRIIFSESLAFIEQNIGAPH